MEPSFPHISNGGTWPPLWSSLTGCPRQHPSRSKPHPASLLCYSVMRLLHIHQDDVTSTLLARYMGTRELLAKFRKPGAGGAKWCRPSSLEDRMMGQNFDGLSREILRARIDETLCFGQPAATRRRCRRANTGSP